MSVPKLRFKEFDKSWCSSPLKELCKINQGLQIAIEERFLDEGQNRYFYITNEFLKEGSKKSYYIENPPKSVICTDLDILMTRTGNTGQVVTGVSGAFHNNFFKIDFDRKIIDRNFFVEFLKKDTTQHWILKYAGASTIPDLNHSDFYRIVMPIPIIEEQTKIASFLSAVDEKISQLVQKHELLSQYKQGMMQKLFSQQIRFKSDDGSAFGEWEELKFKEVIKIKYGKDHKKLDDGDIPVLGTGGIMRYVNSYLYDGESILIGRKGTIDKPQFISGKFWTVDTLFYTEIGEKILPKFAFQQLLLVNWLNLNEATGVPSLNTISIGNIDLKVPSLKEQTKIANFLSSIDQKIEIVAQQIRQAKQWKKSLLQQMLV